MKSGDPVDMVKARNSVLAALPTPSGIPDEELQPIMLPASSTIHEFLNNATKVSSKPLMKHVVLNCFIRIYRIGVLLIPCSFEMAH